MFDKILGVVPLELLPELNEIAREHEDKFRKLEFTGELGGMVKVTIIHPGRITKIEVEDQFFNPNSKKLVLELIPLATERAMESMNLQWREQLQEAGKKIQEIVSRFTDTQGTVDNNQEPNKDPGSEDENLN